MKLALALFVAAILAGGTGFDKAMSSHDLALPLRLASLLLLLSSVVALVLQDEKARRKAHGKRKA